MGFFNVTIFILRRHVAVTTISVCLIARVLHRSCITGDPRCSSNKLGVDQRVTASEATHTASDRTVSVPSRRVFAAWAVVARQDQVAALEASKYLRQCLRWPLDMLCIAAGQALVVVTSVQNP